MSRFKHPLDALKHHVTGAIERGEGKAIVSTQYISEFIASELSELESKDTDTLYECIAENLEDMGIAVPTDFVFAEIERQLKESK